MIVLLSSLYLASVGLHLEQCDKFWASHSKKTLMKQHKSPGGSLRWSGAGAHVVGGESERSGLLWPRRGLGDLNIAYR